MMNPLLSVMFGGNTGEDERYAGKTLKSHGFSSSPTSAGQLQFDLRGNAIQDRIGAVGASGAGLGQIIKLLTYLKGIGAFKGNAFSDVTKPQGVLGGMSSYNPNDPAMNPDPFGVQNQMGQDRQTQQYLNALMMLNQRGV